MTPNQITTLIASNLDKEMDLPFKLQLMERVKYWRSRLVANTLQKDPSQRKYFRQTIFMKMHPTLDIPCAAWISCKVAATINPVPRLVRAGNMYDFVGSPDGKNAWQQTNPGLAKYLSTGKFADRFTEYDTVNDHIVTPKVDQPLVRIDGIFDDPLAAKLISCKCSAQPSDCDVWDTDFPMSGDFTQLVVQSILQIDYNRKDIQPSSEIQVTPGK